MEIRLRPVEEADFAPLAAMLTEPGVKRWWPDDDEASLRKDMADPDVTAFAIEADGALAGWLQIYEEREPGYAYAEPDLFIGEAHQGQGVGAEALRLALRWAFEERGHTRAIIQPAAENERAVRCYEKVGFRPVGIFRRADHGRDSLAMDLLAEELSS